MKVDLLVFRSDGEPTTDVPEGEYLVEIRPDGKATLAWRPNRWERWGPPLKEVNG